MEQMEQIDGELRLVTCPETAHLETIGYIDHPLGMLVESCSRFEPPCGLTCRRTCAALLDRRERASAPGQSGPLEVGDDTNFGLDLADLELHAAPPRAHHRGRR